MPIAFVAGFLMAFIGSMPPIGPVSVLLLERGVTGRDREGRAIALGAAIAETVYCALAMAGMSELIRRYPIVEVIGTAVGVLVLVGLGVYFVRFRIKPQPEGAALGPATSQRVRSAFAVGFTISIANPTLIVTWSGSIATLLSFAHLRFDVPQRCVFVGAVFVGMMSWFRLFLWMLKRYRDRITLRAAQWAVRIAGGAMIVLAIYGGRLLYLTLAAR